MTRRTLFRTAAAAAILVSSSTVAPALAEAPPPRLLVLSKAESKLAIVDPATLEVIARVPTGIAPHEVCVSADGKTAFVADYGANVPGNTITVIDIAAAKAVRTVDLGPLRRPHGMAEHGGKVYFTSELAAAVGRYDPAADKVDLVLGTGQQGSHMLSVDPADGRVYTTNIGSDSVTALDPQRGPGGSPLVAHVPVAGQPEAIALSPDGRELWVAPRAGGPIAVIETAADSVRETIPFDGAAIRLTFTPDGSMVLASDLKEHRLVVIDAKTREPAGEVKVEGLPIGTVVQPDGARAFVSCMGAHKVYAIDLKELKVVGEIDAGAAPDGIAWAAERPAAKAPAKQPGLFGAQMDNLPPAEAAKMNLPGGVLIVQPMPDSPAAKAGLQAGDAIVAVNGKPVANVQAFVRVLQRCSAGDELKLDLRREGQPETATVTLAPRPAPPPG